MARRIGALALLVGGLLPVTLAVIGLVGFVRRGHVLSRSGERTSTALGLGVYSLWLVGGAFLVLLALRRLRR